MTARSLDEIKKSGVLKVAVFSDKAPFGYIDKDARTPLRHRLRRASRQGSGREGQVHVRRSGRRVDVLTSNKVDITLANFTVTDERKEKVDFAKPYMKVALGVVSPENAEITDVSQLKGKTLIIAKGTTAESYFEKNEPDVKLQKYDQYADAYNALLDGRGDAFSTDNTEVLAWAKSNKASRSVSPNWAIRTPSLPQCRRAIRNCLTGSTTKSTSLAMKTSSTRIMRRH